MNAVDKKLPLGDIELLQGIYNNKEAKIHYNEVTDLYYAVCQTVGNATGIKFNKPVQEVKPHIKLQEYINLLANNNFIRMRKIRLRGQWWRYDHGHLVVVFDNRPCALIWHPRGYYQLHDLAHGENKNLSPEIIRDIRSQAYIFYPSLPAKPLSIFALAQFTFAFLKRDILRIIGYQILTSLIMLLIPIFTGIIFDKIIPFASLSLLVQYTLILFIISIIIQGIHLMQLSALIRLQVNAKNKIQTAIWDRLLKLPLSFFQNYTAGDLTYRAGIMNEIQQRLSTQTILSIINGSMSFINLALMLYVNVVLAIAAVILVAIISVASLLFNYIILRYQRQVVHHDTTLSGTLLSLLNGIIKIRVSNKEGSAFAVWNKDFSAKIKAQNQTYRFENGLDVFNVAFMGFSTLVIFSLVIWLGDSLSFGQFIVFNTAFTQYFAAIISLTNLVSESLEILPLFDKAKPIFDAIPEEDRDKATIALDGHIELQNIVFRYPGSEKPLFVDFNMTIEPGSFTAIVGPSGSGKSTLFRLLLGLEHFESGDIKYSGLSINNLQLQDFRAQIGVVMQTTRLIPGSIFDNIAGKNNHLTREEAWEIARIVGLEQLITELPMGMDTLINDGLQTLSGGEAQRINLARAISAKPKILFLDEATSALDNKVQQQIQEYLQVLQLTRVVIAHRFSTIINADQIYVVNEGRCVESGTYETLIKEQGLFYQLAKQQH